MLERVRRRLRAQLSARPSPNYFAGLRLLDDSLSSVSPAEFAQKVREWASTARDVPLLVRQEYLRILASGFDVLIHAGREPPELSSFKSLSNVEWTDLESPLLTGISYACVAGLDVVCTSQHDMGLTDAAVTVSRALDWSRPTVALMVGVCAGIGLEIGEVVVADQAVCHDAGRLDADQFLHNPRMISARTDLVRMCAELPSRPKVGLMASGNAVVNSEAYLRSLHDKWRKIRAIDMECYALYRACQLGAGAESIPLCIKAVSDHAAAKQSVAAPKSLVADRSARVALELMRSTRFQGFLGDKRAHRSGAF